MNHHLFGAIAGNHLPSLVIDLFFCHATQADFVIFLLPFVIVFIFSSHD